MKEWRKSCCEVWEESIKANQFKTRCQSEIPLCTFVCACACVCVSPLVFVVFNCIGKDGLAKCSGNVAELTVVNAISCDRATNFN